MEDPIYLEYLDGMSIKSLAKKHKVTRQAISQRIKRICRKKASELRAKDAPDGGFYLTRQPHKITLAAHEVIIEGENEEEVGEYIFDIYDRLIEFARKKYKNVRITFYKK